MTSWLYDVLDAPWERKYRRWRPLLVGDVTGRALKAGVVGTGRDLGHYPAGAEVHASISPRACCATRAAGRGARPGV